MGEYKVVGIRNFSVYIPFYRLGRGEIAQAWGRKPLSGEKAVANYDEDGITMAGSKLARKDPGTQWRSYWGFLP